MVDSASMLGEELLSLMLQREQARRRSEGWERVEPAGFHIRITAKPYANAR